MCEQCEAEFFGPAKADTAPPVTRAPAHIFASRAERIEARARIERCGQCHHFGGNHVDYVFRSACMIDGCTCGHMIALACGCEYANHPARVHPGPGTCSPECAARGHARILKWCTPHLAERGCID